MKDYSISNYGVFDTAVSTTKNYGTQIDNAETDVKAAKTTLSDGGVLMGPLQDECTRVLATIDTDFSSMKSNFQTMSSQILQTSESYQAGDKSAENTILSTGSKVDTTGLSADIAAKKKAFVGDVDDPASYDPVREGNYRVWKNHMRLFDNTTGEEIPEDGTLVLEKGETRVITVKLPMNTGMIQKVVRTTAADTSNKSGNYSDTYKITSSRSDINPDPAVTEYVNVYPWGTHYIPKDQSILHTNYYDWVITADKVGAREISQTCEYETDLAKGFYFKAMAGINIKIVDNKTKTEDNNS